jgi:BAR domain
MEKLHKSMNQYVKSISKRNEAEDKEKSLPVGYLGKVMISHGEDFEDDSEFGQCLIGLSNFHDSC